MSRWAADHVGEDEYCDGADTTTWSPIARFTHSCSLLHNHVGEHYDSTTGHRWAPEHEEARQ